MNFTPKPYGETAVREIDTVLQRVSEILKSEHPSADELLEAETVLLTLFRRLAPAGTVYRAQFDQAAYDHRASYQIHGRVAAFAGVARAMRLDYQHDHMSSIEGLVRQSVFTDLLDLAEFLLETDKGQSIAAVVCGAVLEEHLLKLAQMKGVSAMREDGKRKAFSALNVDLAEVNAYPEITRDQLFVWYKLRNDGAHNPSQQMSRDDVKAMLNGVRNFLAVFPA